MQYNAIPTEIVRALQAGALDSYGHAPECSISDGAGNPCRHCLRDIPKGSGMLVLAHRPFQSLHPYAETGPIFLCEDRCMSGSQRDIPEILLTSPDYLIKGYDMDDRIVYGTGAVVAQSAMENYVRQIFENPVVVYAHVRSARNNCYQLRIDRQ